MRTISVRAILLFAVAMTLAAAATAQEGHPLAGTWYGEYGAGAQRRDVTVIMKWDGKTITGLFNPGPNASPIKSATMDITPAKPAPEGRGSTEGTPPVFKVRFEVDGMIFEGTIQNPVAGNRRLTGTYSRGAEKGTFQIRRL